MAKAVVAGLVALLFAPATLLLGTRRRCSTRRPGVVPAEHFGVDLDRSATATVPETARVVFPLPAGTWVRTSGFGMRVHPVTGERKLHTGVDFAAPSGTHILAAADGRVAFAGPASGYGHLILIEHTVGGQRVATGYAHMYADGIHVEAGDTVTAGQYIADVGTDGYVTGPHLHFEVRPGGADAAPVDPEPWLASTRRRRHRGRRRQAGDAAAAATAARPRPYAGDDPNHLVDDPTTDGQITERTAHVLAQVQSELPGLRTGPAGRRAPARSRSTRSAAPATAPSATPSAPPRPAPRSTSAGRSPTG